MQRIILEIVSLFQLAVGTKLEPCHGADIFAADAKRFWTEIFFYWKRKQSQMNRRSGSGVLKSVQLQVIQSARSNALVKCTTQENGKKCSIVKWWPFHLRGSSFLMPCNGDDNDADMAIFLHGRRRHELFSFKRCFFSVVHAEFLSDNKRAYKRSSFFPSFIDHLHNRFCSSVKIVL